MTPEQRRRRIRNARVRGDVTAVAILEETPRHLPSPDPNRLVVTGYRSEYRDWIEPELREAFGR